MNKPHCYRSMDWILKYPEDKIPKDSICKCEYTNSCLRLTNNKRKNIKDVDDNMTAFGKINMDNINNVGKLEDIINEILVKKIDREEASWLVWAGWTGNHNQRIDGAKCSKCGHIHPDVCGSTEKLSRYCPNCGRVMSVKES